MWKQNGWWWWVPATFMRILNSIRVTGMSARFEVELKPALLLGKLGGLGANSRLTGVWMDGWMDMGDRQGWLWFEEPG